MKSLLAAVALSSGAVAIFACGDVYIDPDGTVLPQPQIVFDGSAVFPAEIPTRCPTTRPRENTTCDASGSACEYGTSPDRQCNDILTCRGSDADSHWEARLPETCNRSFCPRGIDIDSLDGQPCALDAGASSSDEALCNTTGGVCACTTGRDGANAHPRKWVCVRPTVSLCPATRPLAGQPCQGSLYCDYGSCAFKRGSLMECKGGIWVSGGAPCP
jgi:hypothetical protein